MARTGTSAQTTKSAEPEEYQRKMADEPEEDMEDDVEYEEVEEEVEEEEEEEEEEEVEEEEVEEEEIEEEEEEEDEEEGEGEEAVVAKTVDTHAITANGDDMKDDVDDIHDELLALPPHGSEVYIGGISNDVSNEDLRSFCETVGEVVEIRIISGKDKVYAFVTFRTKELAKDAIETLNNTEFKGKRIKFSTSQAKNKLFIGNVPRGWSEDDLKNVISKIGSGVIGVQLMKDPQNSSRNRGFAFIEYYNHACAEFSRKKMSVPEFKLESNALTVSWADPKSGDSCPSAQIKAIYVKNLPKTVTEDKLKKLFERHGKITKIALPNVKSGQENRIGFVHFAERSIAMKALQNTEIYELDGRVLECSIAKPPADKKAATVTVTDFRKGALLPNYQHQPGLLGGAYGSQPATFAQPMGYGRVPASGVTMVPMILPDGRFGYVLQQPGVPVAAGHNYAGRSGKPFGNRHQQGNVIGGGHRYRPY